MISGPLFVSCRLVCPRRPSWLSASICARAKNTRPPIKYGDWWRRAALARHCSPVFPLHTNIDPPPNRPRPSLAGVGKLFYPRVPCWLLLVGLERTQQLPSIALAGSSQSLRTNFPTQLVRAFHPCALRQHCPQSTNAFRTRLTPHDSSPLLPPPGRLPVCPSAPIGIKELAPSTCVAHCTLV